MSLASKATKSFSGIDALTGQPLTPNPGNNMQNAVSFKLDPKFQGNNLVAVCVTDLSPVDPSYLFGGKEANSIQKG